MNVILYLILFAMGCIFGSFLTLATYRIPINQDITHERSYCPKCNHKLSFLDLIPILSYIFLGGKCRYCKSKISIRYFLMEFLGGISFIILAMLLRINVYTLDINGIIEFGFGALYIVFLFLIAGIDKEHSKVDKRVLIYGIIISILYSIYNFFIDESFNINRFIIYLVVIAIITVINTYEIQKKGKNPYWMNIIVLCIIISLYTYEVATIVSIIVTLIIIAVKLIINRLFSKNKKSIINIKNEPIAFYLCISNALTVLFVYIGYLLW